MTQRLLVLFGLLLTWAGSPARAAEPPEPAGSVSVAERAATAVELYDQARYAEARAAFEALDAEGAAGGPLLYRLHFCLRAMGEEEASLTTLHRARARLEQEWTAAPSIESGFYLANAYQSLERNEDMRRIAAAVLDKVEAGAFVPGSDPLEQFRLGKLYADVERREEAGRWFSLAVEGFAKDAKAHRAYLTWAARYVAESAASRGDWTQVARQYDALQALGEVSQSDLDRLAVAQARQGDYAGAASSWKRAELLNPAEGDRARYCGNLARLAAELGQLPAAAPDARPWSAQSQQELETLMTEYSGRAKAALQEAQENPELPLARRQELGAALGAAKPVFVAAGLEYALRGLGLREAAFFGGYAPLIFRADLWQLPPRPPRRRHPKAGPPAPPATGS